MSDAAKRSAAERACEFVRDGMTVGLGTGSTAAFMVRRLGARVRDEGLRIRGVPTSRATQTLAEEVGVPLASLDDVARIDVTIDGADEVDPRLDLIKGLGGALLREKVVASITARQVIVVDPAKMVPMLGTRSPLPVEVLPFGARVVQRRLDAQGLPSTIRTRDGKPFVTDNGNLVLDVRFADGIPHPRRVETELNNVPGVVENGLFLDIAQHVVIGDDEGKTRVVDRPA